MKRRDFIKSSMAGAAVMAMPNCLNAAPAVASELVKVDDAKNSTIKKAAKEDTFHLGMAGYTFVHFDLDKTIDFMQKLDVHYLCIKDFHLPLNSTDEQIAAFHAKLKEKGIIGYGCGPIYMKNEAEVDRAFAYAKRVGVKLLVGVPGFVTEDKKPNYDILDYVEKKVKEYDITLAIHLHGPDMPLYPNATSIWEQVKDRDPRMGMCLDIGHNLRVGSDSMKDLKRYAKRVFDIHLKDVNAPTKAGHAMELGRGIINFPLFFKTLRQMGYSGSVSLEYEKNMKDSFNEIAESVGYFRGVQYATR